MDDEAAAFARSFYDRYGYDFRGYRGTSLANRLRHLATKLRLSGISELNDWALSHPGEVDFIVENITVPISDYFREPEAFSEVTRHVLPMLSSFSNITIWHAGCAGGEEVYSLAILLTEAGLYPRCRIFASDITRRRQPKAANSPCLSPDRIEEINRRYLLGGGTRHVSSYVAPSGNGYRLDPALLRNVSFFEHNLASDGVFCEANLIFCRNVMIYFGDHLQRRVFDLFQDSLARGGLLCLGSREAPLYASPAFAKAQGCNRLYRPLRPARSPLQPGFEPTDESDE
ncbi:CheR family methyltransferase [Paracoccus ravus]|uniref:CheR family methyltransferase n=1 Tax=Paracoccus ravus TaxID=2447760 RepID=UPI00106E5BBB|nr:CheR family methyltransferase [Paracoccus ravus]